MSLSRRDALRYFGALFAFPLTTRNGPWAFASDLCMADDPLRGTIAQYQAGRLRGEYTALEVTLRALAQCRTTGARLRAVDVLAETAAAEARRSDARLRAKALRGPLDGVPLFAKSIYDMEGTSTSASSADWARLFPGRLRRDAIEVERLRAAGAVLLGKTAADDFAYRGNGTSSFTGQVLNPHDAAGLKTPGGSSAGSAVAVACGMAFCALGTDDGGSNRIPAQFTGVVGMKPTFGLVPRLFLGSLDRSPLVWRRAGAGFVIERDEPGPLHTDGETHEAGRRVEIRVVRRSLRMVVPAVTSVVAVRADPVPAGFALLLP